MFLPSTASKHDLYSRFCWRSSPTTASVTSKTLRCWSPHPLIKLALKPKSGAVSLTVPITTHRLYTIWSKLSTKNLPNKNRPEPRNIGAHAVFLKDCFQLPHQNALDPFILSNDPLDEEYDLEDIRKIEKS